MKRSTAFLVSISLVALMGLFSFPPTALAEEGSPVPIAQEASATIGNYGVVNTDVTNWVTGEVSRVSLAGATVNPQPFTATPVRWFKKFKEKLKGEQGDPGPPGPQGEQGPKGDPGAPGEGSGPFAGKVVVYGVASGNSIFSGSGNFTIDEPATGLIKITVDTPMDCSTSPGGLGNWQMTWRPTILVSLRATSVVDTIAGWSIASIDSGVPNGDPPPACDSVNPTFTILISDVAGNNASSEISFQIIGDPVP